MLRHNIAARDARDRLIGLLHHPYNSDQQLIGTPYPIRDVYLEAASPKVAYQSKAIIRIHQSQRGVYYVLRDEFGGELVNAEEQSFPNIIPFEGTGEILELNSPPILDDIIFCVEAFKEQDGLRLKHLLEDKVFVQVGIDSTLKVIADEEIIDYGASVKITIEKSQEDVDYELYDEHEDLVSIEAVTGNIGDIVIESIPLFEDTIIKVKATKTFEPEEEEENEPPKTETDWLETEISIKLRPNLNLELSVQEEIISYDTHGVVQINHTQVSANYEVYVREISDDEYMHNIAFEVDEEQLISIELEESDPVKVQFPPTIKDWQDLQGFRATGLITQGNGNSISITTESFKEDVLIIVKAEKINSKIALPLKQALAFLVKPSPDAKIEESSLTIAPNTSAVIKLTETQAGIFYQLREDGNQQLNGLPAYHHKKIDQETPKGVDGVKIEVDFVIEPFDENGLELISPALTENTTFSIVATKAQTGVSIILPQPIAISIQ